MLGVNPKFIVHRLNVDSLYPPKKQKPRRLAKSLVEAVKEEVEKLKQVRAIREVFTGRIAKWSTRLGSFDTRYKPRNAIKG